MGRKGLLLRCFSVARRRLRPVAGLWHHPFPKATGVRTRRGCSSAYGRNDTVLFPRLSVLGLYPLQKPLHQKASLEWHVVADRPEAGRRLAMLAYLVRHVMAIYSRWRVVKLLYFFSFILTLAAATDSFKCEELRLGQYICKDPEISYTTQEPVKCTNYTAYAPCYPAPNITCKDPNGNETRFTGKEIGFYRPIPCRNVNGYSYKVAVALSLFLGWLGADRFYLGYPALGMLKFCTVGFCGIGCLIDFVLIIMQIVGPSDGSSYIIDYYGARLAQLTITNETFRKTQMYP